MLNPYAGLTPYADLTRASGGVRDAASSPVGFRARRIWHFGEGSARVGCFERVFLVLVVLDVRDLPIRDGDMLVDERVATAAVVTDPVDSDYERARSGLDELVSS